jgi:hypothetical protein
LNLINYFKSINIVLIWSTFRSSFWAISNAAAATVWFLNCSAYCADCGVIGLISNPPFLSVASKSSLFPLAPKTWKFVLPILDLLEIYSIYKNYILEDLKTKQPWKDGTNAKIYGKNMGQSYWSFNGQYG